MRRLPAARMVFLIGITGILVILGTAVLALDGRRASAMSPLGSLPDTSSTSPLAGLPFARDGRIFHAGSWDRNGGNGDARPIPPGHSLTLLDYHGAGVVRRFWVTIAPEQKPEINRGVVIRCYWDGETTPSVEVPIGDFFGAAFGQKVNYSSAPQDIESGGMNCYWPMPFHKSARIVVTNESPAPVDAFYYNMEVETHRSLPDTMLHFHARWNRENPTHLDHNYVILDAAGHGQYVGTYLEMNSRGRGLGFLEGDEMVYVDGEKSPSINGTGTEDFFDSGWYFDTGTYSTPYHGLILKEDQGRIAAYRWQIEDAIPFQHSIRFTIEHGNQDDSPADYTSVAYWYQAEPHGAQPPLPPYAQRLPDYAPPVDSIRPGHTTIPGDELVSLATASSGNVSVQGMGGFQGEWPDHAQLWWTGDAPDSEMQLKVPVSAAGSYHGSLLMTRAKDYGNLEVLLGDHHLASFTGFTPGVPHRSEVTASKLDLGVVTLKTGDNILTIRITGKEPQSTNYLVGIGLLTLVPEH